MAKKATKLKSKAQVYVPQTKEDAAADIRKVGDLVRKLTRAQADMNDKIAAITQQYQPEFELIQEQIDLLQEGVQGYCEAHRDELTNGGKVKSANLITGEVSWRQNPPSVRVTNAEAVIEMLKRMSLYKFVRTKEEVNKDAILNEPDEVRGIAGITIVSGVEQFVIIPFEQEIA
ncbi:MAG TPA: host-nuclease inhibitor protein Gam [Methylophilaceae bacterium]|nr:host-nuclease inhibitor protein Gam [Methylophilaceae bacterium]